ncbi:MAG: fluoride efflux transporter CrcB [Deltaproteobacteria bacterium]|nr:MAG: fluoride efflux transporter CrcB [Deltaproteobacteria bacterium]
MRALLLVALGGAIGASGRWATGLAVTRLAGTRYPFATFAVNVIGSLLIGLVLEATERPGLFAAEIRLAVATGLLGAFTTFSTFSFETLRLIRGGEYGPALLNAVGSVVVCLGACALGVGLARLVTR